MRRSVVGLAVLALLLAGVQAAWAAPLDDARRRQRALEAELRAATTELQAAEAALAPRCWRSAACSWPWS